MIKNMEQLLHYAWKHKIFPLHDLKTTDGRTVEVVNPGLYNTDAGPDFHDAKIKIDGVLWVGNVELHIRTSDWYRHHHDTDPAYANIILHVAAEVDIPLTYPNGEPMPQLQFSPPSAVVNNYDRLAASDLTPRCAHVLPDLSPLMIHSWMSRLQIERLEYRTEQIEQRRRLKDMSWEDTFFVTLARNFGFGKNGDTFEQWAMSIPLAAVGKHRDSLFQVEAIFYGQAGLLDDPALEREYRYLRQKFSLTPIDRSLWKFMRMRPQNSPTTRIGQLARMYHQERLNLSKVLSCKSVEDVEALFGMPKPTVALIIINTVAPMLFAYGRYKNDEEMTDLALHLLESLPPENNYITRDWTKAGVKCHSAADTQALIHLTHNYCEPHDCLRCRFGYEFIRRTPDFLKEEGN